MSWFNEAADAFLSAQKAKYHSPKTIKNYRNFLGRLRVFLNGRELAEETALAFCASLPARGLSLNSAHTEIVELRTFLKFCDEKKFVPVSFVHAIVKPKLDTEAADIPLVDMLTAEQAIALGCARKKDDNQLAIRVKADMNIALRLVLLTALRFAEVSNIRGEDVFLDAATPFVLCKLKGRYYKKPKKIYLARAAVELLRPISERKGKIFVISNTGCNRALARGMRLLKIPFPITCHGLRHVTLNEEKRSGMPAAYIQQHANHAKFETTVRYYLQDETEDLAPMVDTYNPIARRALSVEDKLKFYRNRLENMVGNDPSFRVCHDEKKVWVEAM